jgi:23S rRNA pseudouridine2605 synthase
VQYKSVLIKILPADVRKQNYWLEVSITEGKNREVRKILEHFELDVSRLIRVEFGKFRLGDLPTGEVREVSYHDFQEYMS